MTVVDLDNIGVKQIDKSKLINWCYDKYGPASEKRWNLCDLRYVHFANDRDATLFILTWS